MNSADFILYCIDVIRADPNLSDVTLQRMFIEYGQKLLSEKKLNEKNK